MKRTVNGELVELPESDEVDVWCAGDRMIVRSSSGSRSALAVQWGDGVLVSYDGRQFMVENDVRRTKPLRSAHTGEIRAPMPGLITSVNVELGQEVRTGDRLVVLEAMKTQQSFLAPFDGKVESVHVRPLEQVVEGHLLVLISASGA